VGGVLTQALDWHWIFFINVPIGIATFVLGRALIDENVGLGIRNGVDVTGSVLVTGSLMVGIYAIITATQYGWASAHTLGLGGVAVLLFIAFFGLEARLKNPIMPLRILRIRTLTNSSIIRGFVAAGIFTTFFLGALYLENVLGYSPIRTGVAFLPVSLMMGVLSAGVTARLVTRFGSKPVLIPGMVSATVGLLLLTRVAPGSSYFTVVFPAFILIGLGAGTSFIPLLTIAMSQVPKDDAGLGSGIVNVSMQMSAAVGLAVLGTIATNRTRTLEAAGRSSAAALSGGFRLSFLIAAACVAVGTVVALAILKGRVEGAVDPDVLLENEAEVASGPFAS
jgi:MFS family permease